MQKTARVVALALVLGVFPLVAGALLERPLTGWLLGDWLLGWGPLLAGLLVALLQELARVPAAAVLGWLGGRLIAGPAAAVVVGAMLAGYLYTVLLRLVLGTADQLLEPGYLVGKLLSAAGLCLLADRLARRARRNLLDRSRNSP